MELIAAVVGGARTMSALSPSAHIDTQHEDHIHDCQWDYYARRLATASSDRTVKVWNVEAESHALSATLTGHDGPVWEVAWAHPQYGTVLASCSYDGTVLVFKEDGPGRWSVVHKFAPEASQPVSINSIEFAPSAFGQLILACASSDGHVTVLRHDAATAEWGQDRFLASPLGTNAVSWAPLGVNGSTRDDGSPILRLATGSADCLVKVWSASAPDEHTGAVHWDAEPMADGGKLHKAWVRDVAFCPFYGVPQPCLASCSEDKSVYVWCRGDLEMSWTPKKVVALEQPCWRVNWSVTGNILAVSSGDDDVSMWKETIQGEWFQLGEPEKLTNGAAAPPN